MKGSRGKFLKKLKSIKPIGSLKPARLLQISNAFNGFLDPSSSPNASIGKTQQASIQCNSLRKELINVDDAAQVTKDLEDENTRFGGGDDRDDNKENIAPPSMKSQNPSMKKDVTAPLPVKLDSDSQDPSPDLDVPRFRRPDLNSGSLFDPNLLAAFEKARTEHTRALEAARRARKDDNQGPPSKARRLEENPLMEFEEKCPPGGGDTVILYTTGLRGIRKTFEDCQRIRFLLDSFRILFYERDVSMHLEFREELWRTLGSRAVPPRLFIRGRYIGGAEQVVGLHEKGRLLELFEDLPRDQSTCPCNECGGIRFIVCYNCDGSRKIRAKEGKEGLSIKCSQCNENGLIICPMCC